MEKNPTEPRTSKAEGKVHLLERIIRELISVNQRNSHRLGEEGRPSFKPVFDRAEQDEVNRLTHA